MDEGYLKNDCVISADHGDGEKGQKVSKKEIGEKAFKKLVFNGVISETPVKSKKKAEKA